jgi:hypothetical protein
MNEKMAYVCGPLTELNRKIVKKVKFFYERIGDVCEEVLGKRAFVPHEHFDPIKSPQFTPAEVDTAERDQVCNKTSVLIVVAIAPSWGGGIEVEMARQNNVPVVLLCEKKKLRKRKISRLLRGNSAIRAEIDYTTYDEALSKLRDELSKLVVAKVAA